MTKRMQLAVLDPDNPEQGFPPLSDALAAPDGLLAVGGCLSKNRLLAAYRQGIFPWNGPDEPLLWWSPNPRLVLFPGKLQVSRRLAKTVRQKRFDFTIDQAFTDVVKACAKPRKKEYGTWITDDILSAYTDLYQSGNAHSAEAWRDGKLVGGLYGVAIGQVFFGESMFHTETDASKVVFVQLIKLLAEWGYQLVDCQITTKHLMSLGAEEIPRSEFTQFLDHYCEEPPEPSAWQGL